MIETKHLETERLILRPMRESDKEDFLSYFIEPNTSEWLGGALGDGDDIAQLTFRANCLTPLTWAAERKDTGRVIGDVHLADLVGMYLATIGYVIHCSARGQGFGREAVRAVVDYALNETSLGRIRAVVLTRNLPSMRLLEACGFHREAKLCDADYGGRIEDVYYYSIAKGDLQMG